MKSSLPDDLPSARIDLEVDLEERGGIQRFKTVQDVLSWLDEEKSFWKWAEPHHQRLGNAWGTFVRLESQARQVVNGNTQHWQQLVNQLKQPAERVANKDLPEQELKSAEDQINSINNQLEEILNRLKRTIESQFKTDIVQKRVHLCRHEPAAQFTAKIAETDPEAASFALAYFLPRQNYVQSEFKGRMLAAMYAENLNKKVRADNSAFKTAIKTWSTELQDFKGRFEHQEAEFGEISQKHHDAETTWKERHDGLAEDFGDMRQNAEFELKTLKDTYDAFMQLEAPREYWAKKREEHRRGKKVMGWLSVVAGIVGVTILSAAAFHLLPQQYPTGSIPWRQLGLFLLATTFCLWVVRLFVRLLLSHIHLYADAHEREVMISTFLALVHRQESREGLKKEDIALVLAPIFRPSTTGVIKDDGGPKSFGDLLGALTSGRS